MTDTSFPDLIELDVERPAVGGRMIARHDGRVVLVSGAIPGERVRARVERQRPSLLLARTVEVLDSSADRRSVPGDALCGGRDFAHIDYQRQRTLKGEIVADAFRRIGRIPLDDGGPVVVGSPERGYRVRARLHVQAGRVGFLRSGTHQLCAADETAQLLPATERVLGALEASSSRLQRARVESLELAEDLVGGQRVIHLQVEGDPTVAETTLAPVLETAGVSGWSLASTQAGGAPRLLAGDTRVIDPLSLFLPAPGAGVLSLGRHPTAFFQANRYLTPELVATVDRLVTGDAVVDLYAGVGLFAVALAAARGGAVTAVEQDPVGAADLRRNAEPLAPAVDVAATSVEEYLAGDADLSGATVLVDPPRIGLSTDARRALIDYRPRELVYVSCDVATQARDLRTFVEAGYGLEEVVALDMFPGTAHVETVARLRAA